MERTKVKKTVKSYLLGFLSATVLASGVTYAANTTTLYDVITNGIKIVIDGQKINPTDANGNRVEPIIYNGTTYLPVRAVANALGKAVYWDGPNYTVYLGNMDGDLQYPTEELNCDDNIGDSSWGDTTDLKDNLGNTYSRAICTYGSSKIYEKLCNMKFSRFKGTIYVKNGINTSYTVQFVIKADGKTIYTSPEISKSSSPIDFDLDITGCYDLQIICTGDNYDYFAIGDGGFYQ